MTHPPANLPLLPPRDAHAHKGDFGRLLLIGGSRGMAGSISLAGMAALRSGAGLVKLAVPSVCLDTVAGFDPCYMTIPLPSDAEGRIAPSAKDVLTPLLIEADCLAIGPGLGRNADLCDLVAWLYSTAPNPLVVDADGLYALAQRTAVFQRHPAGPRVLTPHAGEFARLVRQPRIAEEQRETLAQQFATQSGCMVVLKGHGTVITDGQQVHVNSTGNPGMATGGTGDVLTGIITALIGQRMSPLDAARLGVYLHGLAGDFAAAELGQVSLTAHDLVKYLPRAFASI